MRVLLVGLGAVGQRHARNLRTLLGPELSLHAWRRRRDRAVIDDQLVRHPDRDVEQELGIAAHDTIEAALAARPDAVIVSGPSAEHLAVARRAVDAGCHLFVEKPLADRWAGVPELLEAVARAGVVGMMGCQWRFHPLVERLREWLTADALGPLVRVDATYGEWLPGWHPYEDYRQSYAARAELGGGVLLTQIHDLDLLHHLLGGPPDRVFAVGGAWTSLGIPVEDVVEGVLLHRADAGRPLPVHLAQNLVQRPPTRSLTVVGEGAVATLDLLGGTLVRTEANGTPTRWEVSPEWRRNDMFLAALADFLRACGGGPAVRVPLADGAAVLRTALALKHSMAHGVAVTPAEVVA